MANNKPRRPQSKPGALSHMFQRPKKWSRRLAVGGVGGSVAQAWRTWSRGQKRADKDKAEAEADRLAMANGGKRRGGRRHGTDGAPNRENDIRPPLWATWSLGRNAAATEAPSIVIDDTHVTTMSDTATGTATLTTLLRHRNDDDIHSSQWEDYFNDTPMMDARESMASAVKRVKAYKKGHPLVTAKEARSPATLLEAADQVLQGEPKDDKSFVKELESQILTKPGFLRFDPLTLVESTNLARCLRLSQFVPEPPPPVVEGGKDSDLAFRAPSDKKLTFLDGVDTLGALRAERLKEAARLQPVRQSTAARKKAARKEEVKNEATKELFKSMCRLMLPRRHFDWIVAQLTFGRAEMLGRVPAALSLNGTVRQNANKAKQAVENGEMRPDSAALVLHALAEASRLSMGDIALADPNALTANISEAELRQYKRKQRAEAATVTKVLRTLFPDMFGITEGTTDHELAERARADAMRRLEVVKRARAEARVGTDQGVQSDTPPAATCSCSHDQHDQQRVKIYAESAMQTGESSVPAQQKPKRMCHFAPYEHMLPWAARQAKEKAKHNDGRGTSSTRDHSETPAAAPNAADAADEGDDVQASENEDEAMEEDEAAEAETEAEAAQPQEDGGYESDWADVDYEPVPIEQILDAVVYTMEDHKKLYEMAMVSFRGKMPFWLKQKFQRDCRRLYRAEREREKAEEAKLKEGMEAENKLLQLARERDLAQALAQKGRDAALRERQRARAAVERDRKRKRDERKKKFLLNERGKLMRPQGPSKKGDNQLRAEVLAETKERQAKEYEIELQRATKRLQKEEKRQLVRKRREEVAKHKEIRKAREAKRKEFWKQKVARREQRLLEQNGVTTDAEANDDGQADVTVQPVAEPVIAGEGSKPQRDFALDPRLFEACVYAGAATAPLVSSEDARHPLANSSSLDGLAAPTPSSATPLPALESVADNTLSTALPFESAVGDTCNYSMADDDTTMVNGCLTLTVPEPQFAPSQDTLDMHVAFASPAEASTGLPEVIDSDTGDVQASLLLTQEVVS